MAHPQYYEEWFWAQVPNVVAMVTHEYFTWIINKIFLVECLFRSCIPKVGVESVS